MTVTLASPKSTWVGTAGNPVTLSNVELRRADAAMVASAGISSGLAVSVDGADLVTVTAGNVVISGEDAVTGTGVYRAGTGSSVTGSLEARDATNARIDLVVFRQYDPTVVGAHVLYGSAIEIIKGTPSATPAVPTKPSMAVELARITVPASGGGAASADSANRAYASAVGSKTIAYTPTLSDTTTGAKASTGAAGYYYRTGDWVHAWGEATFAAAATNGARVSLPVTASVRQIGIGVCGLFGTATPADQSGLASMAATMNALDVIAYSAGFRPAAVGHTIRFSVTYRA